MPIQGIRIGIIGEPSLEGKALQGLLCHRVKDSDIIIILFCDSQVIVWSLFHIIYLVAKCISSRFTSFIAVGIFSVRKDHYKSKFFLMMCKLYRVGP